MKIAQEPIGFVVGNRAPVYYRQFAGRPSSSTSPFAVQKVRGGEEGRILRVKRRAARLARWPNSRHVSGRPMTNGVDENA